MFHPPTNCIISTRRRTIRMLLMTLGMTLMIWVVLFGSGEDHTSRTLWIVDNSLSMAVEDVVAHDGVFMSRLALAQSIVASGSQIIPTEQAIMSTALYSRLELPMTRDTGLIRDVVDALTPIVHGGGSQYLSPLQMAGAIYSDLSDHHVIWITDGEFSDRDMVFSGTLHPQSLTIIGVGTRSGGPIIERYDSGGRPVYKSSLGKKVHSIRDDTLLQSLSEKIGAKLILMDTPRSLSLTELGGDETSSQGLLPMGSMIFAVLLVLTGLMIPRYRLISPLGQK